MHSYLEDCYGQDISQDGETHTEKQAKDDVIYWYKAITVNLFDKICQKRLCWAPYFPFHLTMIPYFAESLKVSSRHFGTASLTRTKELGIWGEGRDRFNNFVPPKVPPTRPRYSAVRNACWKQRGRSNGSKKQEKCTYSKFLRCRCSALPTELSRQQGAGHIVSS